MDIISHGLWGGIAFGRSSKKAYIQSFAFGVAPDLFSFGIYTAFRILGLEKSVGYMDASLIPQYVHVLYSITHSLLIFSFVFALLWFIFKKPFLPALAWFLHILIDIPTHSIDFFPTPFLWPISHFRVNGVSWATPWVFYSDIAFLFIFYILFFVFKRKK